MSQYSVGELVRWFEYYQDRMLKDTGYGTIVSKKEYPISSEKNYTVYDILKQSGIIDRFEDCEISRIDNHEHQ